MHDEGGSVLFSVDRRHVEVSLCFQINLVRVVWLLLAATLHFSDRIFLIDVDQVVALSMLAVCRAFRALYVPFRRLTCVLEQDFVLLDVLAVM